MKKVKIKSWAKMMEEGHIESHIHNSNKELCLWNSKDEFSFTKTMETAIPANRIIEINGNREWIVSQTGVFNIEEWMIEYEVRTVEELTMDEKTLLIYAAHTAYCSIAQDFMPSNFAEALELVTDAGRLKTNGELDKKLYTQISNDYEGIQKFLKTNKKKWY